VERLAVPKKSGREVNLKKKISNRDIGKEKK